MWFSSVSKSKFYCLIHVSLTVSKGRDFIILMSSYKNLLIYRCMFLFYLTKVPGLLLSLDPLVFGHPVYLVLLPQSSVHVHRVPVYIDYFFAINMFYTRCKSSPSSVLGLHRSFDPLGLRIFSSVTPWDDLTCKTGID